MRLVIELNYSILTLHIITPGECGSRYTGISLEMSVVLPAASKFYQPTVINLLHSDDDFILCRIFLYSVLLLMKH